MFPLHICGGDDGSGSPIVQKSSLCTTQGFLEDGKQAEKYIALQHSSLTRSENWNIFKVTFLCAELKRQINHFKWISHYAGKILATIKIWRQKWCFLHSQSCSVISFISTSLTAWRSSGQNPTLVPYLSTRYLNLFTQWVKFDGMKKADVSLFVY